MAPLAKAEEDDLPSIGYAKVIHALNYAVGNEVLEMRKERIIIESENSLRLDLGSGRGAVLPHASQGMVAVDINKDDGEDSSKKTHGSLNPMISLRIFYVT